MADSSDVQVALTGNEGMVNVSLVLDVQVSSLTNVAQGAGRAFRIHHTDLQKLLNVDPYLRSVLNLYISLRMNQLARNMACASFHTVEQRLARWLLTTKKIERIQMNFCSPRKMLYLMLGVRRESETQAAGALQKKELISYGWGEIMLLNQPGLEAAACGCYAADLAIFERAVVSQVPAQKPEMM